MFVIDPLIAIEFWNESFDSNIICFRRTGNTLIELQLSKATRRILDRFEDKTTTVLKNSILTIIFTAMTSDLSVQRTHLRILYSFFQSFVSAQIL